MGQVVGMESSRALESERSGRKANPRGALRRAHRGQGKAPRARRRARPPGHGTHRPGRHRAAQPPPRRAPRNGDSGLTALARRLRKSRSVVWTREEYEAHGLHRLRGTIRYPKPCSRGWVGLKDREFWEPRARSCSTRWCHLGWGWAHSSGSPPSSSSTRSSTASNGSARTRCPRRAVRTSAYAKSRRRNTSSEPATGSMIQ